MKTLPEHFCIKRRDPEHSEVVQRYMFSRGWSWFESGKVILNTDKEYLIFYMNSKKISYSGYCCGDYQELTLWEVARVLDGPDPCRLCRYGGLEPCPRDTLACNTSTNNHKWEPIDDKNAITQTMAIMEIYDPIKKGLLNFTKEKEMSEEIKKAETPAEKKAYEAGIEQVIKEQMAKDQEDVAKATKELIILEGLARDYRVRADKLALSIGITPAQKRQLFGEDK